MSLRKATKEEINIAKECRNSVKTANFALLYGSGVNTYAKSLRKANPLISEKQSIELAKKAIKLKKGVKNKEGLCEGGVDSDSFNAMFKIAMSPTPTLPALGTQISDALRPGVCDTSFMTGRMNFVIQAQGSEFLASLLTMIAYLGKINKIENHFTLAIHDEVHFIVREEDREKFAALMNVAHYMVWKLFHEAWGIKEFPICRMYFDQLDSRHCIVKEPEENLTTPSNPLGYEEKLGVGIKAKDVSEYIENLKLI